MSVEMDTARAGVKADAIAAPRKGGRRRIVPAPSRPLVLICERCDKRVQGAGAGFAALDLREAHTAAQGGGKAPWYVLHHRCAPDVVKPLNPYFRIWAERMANVNDLLDTVAELSRAPWFGATDWGGLVRRVLADTDAAADDAGARYARRAAQRRRERGQLASDDPRHGTDNAYVNWGCRCERCRAANTEARNARKEGLSVSQGVQRKAADR